MPNKKWFGKRDAFVCLFLIFAVISIYLQLNNYKFIDFDDNLYVTENAHVNSGITTKNLEWAFQFTKKDSKTYWHPLTMISHMLDCQLFGLDPAGHHMMNVLFHILNTLLVFIIFRKSTGEMWKSFFVAALFAVHPINVDSVAWIAERKNLLSTFFWLLTILTYFWYNEKRSKLSYFVVFIFMALGLLSKPMLVTLPCVLLLLDLWPLNRMDLDDIKKNLYLVVEKIPLFILSAGWVLLSSFSMQRMQIEISTINRTMALRITNALHSYMLYLVKMFWPTRLSVYYPYPDKMMPYWQVAWIALLLMIITFLVLRYIKEKPWLTVGWLWFLGTLVPVSGIMQNGLWPAMADRWAYVPFIGLYIMIVFGISDLSSNKYFKQIIHISGFVFISALGLLAAHQAEYWSDSASLFKHALHVTSRNAYINKCYGAILRTKGDLDGSINYFKKAIKINSYYLTPYLELGFIYLNKNKADEAAGYFTRIIEMDRNFHKAHYGIGLVLAKKNMRGQAIKEFSEALRIKPDFFPAMNDMANTLAKEGKFDSAIDYYLKVLNIKPDDAEAHNNLAGALIHEQRFAEAVKHYQEALLLAPGKKKILDINLCNALKKQAAMEKRKGNNEKALSLCLKIINIQPKNYWALMELSSIYTEKKDYKKAVSYLEKMIGLKRDNPALYYNLGCLYSLNNDPARAIKNLKLAVARGYDNWDLLRTDSDLNNIRSMTEFKLIFKKND